MTFAACGGNSTSSPTPPNNPAPTVTFSADHTSITSGQTVTLTWATTNATSVSITPSVGQATSTSGSATITPTTTTTYTIVATGAGGSAQATTTITVTTPAPTVTISADSTNVTIGSSVNLTWSSTNATSVTITPSISASALPVSGTQPVTVSATTTYTIVATGSGGTAQGAVTITAIAPVPPTLTFSVDNPNPNVGALIAFTWATTNATSFTVTPSILGEDQTILGLSGTQTVAATATQTYVATATGPGGTATQSITITVTGTPTITAFTASPASVGLGGTSTLSWSTTNTSSVAIDNNVLASGGPNGSQTVSPTATTTYTLTATGPAGTTTAQTTVTVNPVSITLSAAPTTITPGGSSTLTWTSTGATSVMINGVMGTQPPSGSATVNPSQTTTYTATASDGNGNTATSTATVTVVTSTGDITTIKHIIFMVQENRSFDNYFGKLGAYRASRVPGTSPSDINDLDQLPSNFAGLKTRSDAANHPNYLIPPFHERTLQTENLSPSWSESHYDAHLKGLNYMNVTSSSTFLMDYFLQTTHSVSPDKYDPDGTRPMGYYDQTDLPYYYELATQFATSDAFHSPLLSQTNPNRMYLFAATSIGRCNADPGGHPLWPSPTIFNSLVQAGVSWRYYYQDGVFLAQFQDWNNPKIQGNVYNISNLFTVLSQPNADSQLPSVIFIERGEATDEHPDNNIQNGATVVKSIIDALMASSAWKDSIFILTYDEGGGLYDHVPPFLETPPDNIAPNCPTLAYQGQFNLSGFRVPLIVMSPYAKPHFVSHTNMDSTSILKLIETRFNLPPLTQRDANAPDMTEFFDFTNPYWLTPPPLPAQQNECLTTPSRCSQQLEQYPNF